VSRDCEVAGVAKMSQASKGGVSVVCIALAVGKGGARIAEEVGGGACLVSRRGKAERCGNIILEWRGGCGVYIYSRRSSDGPLASSASLLLPP
jgi:hypothetical protein